jgi:hypothetical protein
MAGEAEKNIFSKVVLYADAEKKKKQQLKKILSHE